MYQSPGWSCSSPRTLSLEVPPTTFLFGGIEFPSLTKSQSVILPREKTVCIIFREFTSEPSFLKKIYNLLNARLQPRPRF